MPYVNEHACRLRNPDDFQKDSFRRIDRDHVGKKYSVIMGKLKGDEAMTEQAYRYNEETWTVSDAKNHCESYDGTFEPAGKRDDLFKGENRATIDSMNKKEGKNEDDDIEQRVLAPEDVELRVEGSEKPILVGYAAKYNKRSQYLGWFIEKIQAGAFDDVLKTADVRALKNHNPNLLLGRTSSGTLRLKSDSVGLRFEIDVPDTTTGRDIIEEIKRKDMTGCSFSFAVAEDVWNNNEDGNRERTIIKVSKLLDVGPVTYPAYPDTAVAIRSLEEFNKRASNAAENSQEIDIEHQRQIEKKYKKAGRIINRNKPAEV